MSSEALESLAARLGVGTDRLPALEGYDDAKLRQLDDLVAAAVAAEDTAISTSLEEAVRFVPRPLRGRARSILFPEGDR